MKSEKCVVCQVVITESSCTREKVVNHPNLSKNIKYTHSVSRSFTYHTHDENTFNAIPQNTKLPHSKYTQNN